MSQSLVITDQLDGSAHEQVVRCSDARSGLVAYVAIHSTALGAALGGTRFQPYASEGEALADALRLARAMSYKNALAGLPHGGGKAVIIGDPATRRKPALLHAYGRFVEALNGRYVTAADAGTQVADMDEIASVCRWVTGRSVANGGCGDSSLLTAFGLFQGMRAAAEARWGNPSLTGRHVGVCGVGKVGTHLVGHLLADGAEVTVTDVDPAAVQRLWAEHPEVADVPDADALIRLALDVYAPCALGGALTDDVAGVLQAEIVCGAANNQLSHPGVAAMLAARGILFAPDFVVNAGGVIQVADELRGYSPERARTLAGGIYATTRDLLAAAVEHDVLPVHAAEQLAEARMAAGPWAGTLFPGLAAAPTLPG